MSKQAGEENLGERSSLGENLPRLGEGMEISQQGEGKMGMKRGGEGGGGALACLLPSLQAANHPLQALRCQMSPRGAKDADLKALSHTIIWNMYYNIHCVST